MSEIVIKPDQMAVVKGETVLVTMALGSSLAICMYDEEAGIGGMVHTLLPGIRRDNAGKNGLRYVDTAALALYEAMKEDPGKAGRRRENLLFCRTGRTAGYRQGECDLCKKNASGTGGGDCIGGYG